MCCICKSGYFSLNCGKGFFFWMDVVGTVSLIFDIPWLTPEALDSDSSLLRASRTSRVGARAARVTKLVRVLRVVRVVRVVKLLKYVRAFGAQRKDDEEDMPPASITSRALSEMTSKRVAMLCMLFVIQMPLMQYEALKAVPQRAHLDAFERQLQLGKRIDAQEIADFFKFYEHGDSRPWRLQLPGGQLHYVQGAYGSRAWSAARLVYNGTAQASDPRLYFARSAANIEMEAVSCAGVGADNTTCIKVDVNTRDRMVEEATLSIILIICVILYLVGFTMSLQSTTERIVVRPIERIFGALQTAMSELLAAARAQTHDDSEDGAEKTEMNVLENAVLKLSKLGQSVTHGNSEAARNMVEAQHIDVGTKEWLEGNFTTGVRQRRRSVQAADVSALAKRKRGAHVPLVAQ